MDTLRTRECGRDLCAGSVGNQVIVVVSRVHEPRELQLFQVVEANDPLCLCLGLAQGGQQHAGKDRDDRDYDEQFDQRERREAPRPRCTR
jgi:hypothetical protein